MPGGSWAALDRGLAKPGSPGANSQGFGRGVAGSFPGDSSLGEPDPGALPVQRDGGITITRHMWLCPVTSRRSLVGVGEERRLTHCSPEGNIPNPRSPGQTTPCATRAAPCHSRTGDSSALQQPHAPGCFKCLSGALGGGCRLPVPSSCQSLPAREEMLSHAGSWPERHLLQVFLKGS